MSNDMKCPFCQDYLIPCIKNQNDWIYHCDNPKCPMYDDADIEDAKHPLASKDLWQELIRTRKALDVAQKAMLEIHYQAPSIKVADKILTEALKEIKTALEQKD